MKINLLKYVLSLLILFFSGGVFAQSVKDIRINEVLLYNDSNIVDEYYERNAWIEIFNSAYNQVDISSMFITNDLSNKKKHRLNSGLGANYISTRGFLLYWADGKTHKGTNHLSFTINEGDIIAIFDIDGNLIDSMTIVNQQPNVSYGRIDDGSQTIDYLKYPTPNGTNTPEVEITAAEKFKQLDQYGVGMAVIAMTVVFSSLIMLYLVFSRIGNYFKKQKASATAKHQGASEKEKFADSDESGCMYAAIGLALHQYSSDLHDFEEAVLTINKVSRTYSPWSSKIYSIRQTPEKR